ncbi:winged helix-turn-helix domain-containing protein [Bombiscardovia coagulans]|uniref:ArsR family transcriptional regulator n=1 Tax=Bombiscardovia coagulans TaxID=686666 RepID=A0A261EPF7_9BIFI|nr:helix-turn-helix domain-containing protein [Bombiscardovia coagulans]OZG48734.1 ArsR family transcriptional regulator [Bombiscardovia coagulans]
MKTTLSVAAEPLTNNTETVTNAGMLRAMASPIRMRILGVLRIHGEQTVGQISEQIHEAPGSVSYHLGRLADAGLAQEVESSDSDRRKSWWRACQSSIYIDGSNAVNAGDKDEAVDLFRRSAALSYEMAYERFLDTVPKLPAEWVAACTSEDHVLQLTVEEMRLMLSELADVISRWKVKAQEGKKNDSDARTVALVLQAYRWIP